MSSPRIVALLAVLAVVLPSAASPPAHADMPPSTDLGSGAWMWFADPRAVYYARQHRRSYATWVDTRGDAVLGAYDYDTASFKTVVLRRGIGRDDHANPTLLVLPKGRLEAFYSAHGGKHMYTRRTRRPE